MDWEVECAPVLGKHFDVASGTITYGQTARFFCDAKPAIEVFDGLQDFSRYS